MAALPIATSAQVRAYARGLFRRHPRALAVALILHGLAAVAGLAMPWLIGDLVDAIQHGTTTATVDLVALSIVGFVVVQSVLIRFAKLASASLGERVLAELREDFVDRTLAIPLSTVERAGTGDLLTGHAVLRLDDGEIDRVAEGHAVTTVRFARPDPAELEAYLATGEPLVVAGAFTLDGLGGWFVEGVDGDPSNVIGISLPLTRRLLAGVGVRVTDWWT